MTDKPLKTLNGKKFEGALAEPIDTGLFMPLAKDAPGWPEYLAKRAQVLSAWRLAKLPDLARHLGIDPEPFLSGAKESGFLMLATMVTMEMAAHVVPGFQEKARGKNPREVIAAVRMAVDALKAGGKVSSDLDACRRFLKFETPDLARAAKRTELEKRAHSLQNQITKDRASAARAEKALHKKPRLRVVK